MVTEVFKGDKVSKMELRGLFLLFLIMCMIGTLNTRIKTMLKSTRILIVLIECFSVRVCILCCQVSSLVSGASAHPGGD